jgi:ABC-type multidrug transport system fused ATPase/permease subunit
MLAYDYPLLSVFWTMLWFFAFVIWIWVLVAVMIDIFRSRDMGGFAKAMWFLFVLVVPIIGVLTYLIARGHKMSEHAQEDAKAQDAAMRAYVQEAAGTASSADELTKLAGLRDHGVISEAEFEREKAKILT